MKKLAIAIVSFALLLGLSGCMHHGSGHASATYSDDHLYPSFYFGHPWYYPWGFFSFGYNYYYPYRVHVHGDHKHRHPPHDSHPPGLHKKHEPHRAPDQHLRKNEDDFRGRPQFKNDRGRHRDRN